MSLLDFLAPPPKGFISAKAANRLAMIDHLLALTSRGAAYGR